MASKKGVVSREFPMEGLVGGKAPPLSIVRRGMADLERELDYQFKERIERDRALAKATQAQRAVMKAALNVHDRDGNTLKALRALHEGYVKRKLKAPPTIPEQSRTFVGSIGARVAPPFNYQWTWKAPNRPDPGVSVSATANNGAMNFELFGSGNAGDASVRAAVGIYFRPATANGLLDISAAPAMTYRWWTSTCFDSVHSDGFIGLYVGRYTLAGSVDGQWSTWGWLWNDNSWWFGASGSGSSPGYTLFAQFPVDQNHWYALWVWMGGGIANSGWSYAGGELRVSVPWMTWLLH